MTSFCIWTIFESDLVHVEHPKMTIIAGLHAGLTGLCHMVSNDITATETCHIADTASAIPGPIVVKDQLNPVWRSVCRKEFNIHIG
jgi:hypothetical protein